MTIRRRGAIVARMDFIVVLIMAAIVMAIIFSIATAMLFVVVGTIVMLFKLIFWLAYYSVIFVALALIGWGLARLTSR